MYNAFCEVISRQQPQNRFCGTVGRTQKEGVSSVAADKSATLKRQAAYGILQVSVKSRGVEAITLVAVLDPINIPDASGKASPVEYR